MLALASGTVLGARRLLTRGRARVLLLETSRLIVAALVVALFRVSVT
jgi:hypothetical protein